MKIIIESIETQAQYSWKEIRYRDGIYRTVSPHSGKCGVFRFITQKGNVIIMNDEGVIEELTPYNQDNTAWIDKRFVESFERIVIDNT